MATTEAGPESTVAAERAVSAAPGEPVQVDTPEGLFEAPPAAPKLIVAARDEAEADAAPTAPVDAADGAAPPESEPGLSLATVIGGPEVVGRPTWLDVPPEQVDTLLGLFADEGARLVAMTVLPPDADAPPDPAVPPAPELDLRYHFVVYQTAITVSTRTPLRSAPSAAERFPALAWRERELAGEYGLRFVTVPSTEC